MKSIVFAVFLISQICFAQSYIPPSLTGLSSSTDDLTPYIKPPQPAAGTSYVDTYHQNGTEYVNITRIPSITPTCNIRAWNILNGYYMNTPVSYNGHFYRVPKEAGVQISGRYSKVTNATSATGTNVLHFASTLPGATNWLYGMLPGVDVTLSGTGIPANTTATSWDSTSITLSNNLTADVPVGASILIWTYPTQAPWVEIPTQAEACAMTSTVVDYSSRQLFNADETKFMVLPRTLLETAAFYKTQPTTSFYKLITNVPAMVSTNGSETWDKTDPDVMYYFDSVGGPKFRKINVETGAITTLYTFTVGSAPTDDCPTGFGVVQNGGAGNPSVDQRYWPAMCIGSTTSRILVYDKVNNVVSAKRDVSAICGDANPHPIDIVTMSPSGQYLVASWINTGGTPEDSWSTCHGAEVFNASDLTSKGMGLTYPSGHLDVGYDAAGREVIVSTLNAHKRSAADSYPSLFYAAVAFADVHAPPYDITHSYVHRWRVPCSMLYQPNGGPDPYTSCNFGSAYVQPGGSTFHASGRGAQEPTKGGWFLESSVVDGGAYESDGRGWGKAENLAVYIDTTNQPGGDHTAVFRRISRNLSSRINVNMPACSAGGGYWQEAHGTVNRGWTKIMFSGSWLSECDRQDAYIVNLLATSGPTTPTISIDVSRNGTGAIVKFGRAGLTHNQSCTITASSGSTTLATLISASGKATRYVGFNDIPLVDLTFRADCGSEYGSIFSPQTPAVSGTGSIIVKGAGSFTVDGAWGSVSSYGGIAIISSLTIGTAVPYQICRTTYCGEVKYEFPQ